MEFDEQLTKRTTLGEPGRSVKNRGVHIGAKLLSGHVGRVHINLTWRVGIWAVGITLTIIYLKKLISG